MSFWISAQGLISRKLILDSSKIKNLKSKI